MPLIDLRTDLKSLRYGSDRRGGGDSGQPFIQNIIPDTVTGDRFRTEVSVGSRNLLRYLGVQRIPLPPNLNAVLNQTATGRTINDLLGTDDGLVRGGVLGAAQASVNDLFRIGSFFLTLPKGPLFIAKQVGLQLSNPKLEVKKGVTATARDLLTGNVGGVLGTLTGGILGPTRTYNLGINTIAQVPVNAFGGHFYRHGVLPVQGEDTKYESVVTSNNKSKNSQFNRLVELANKFELGDNELESNSGVFNFSKAKKANRKSNRDARKEVRQRNKAAIQAAKNQRNYRQSLITGTTPLQPTSTTPFSPLFPLPSQQSAAIGAAILNQPAPPATFPISGPLTTFGFNKEKKPKRNKVDRTSQVIDSYITGPGSVYGVGLTLINRYQFTEDISKYQDAIDAAFSNAGKGLLNGERHDITYFDPQTSGSILDNAIGSGNNSISEYDGVSKDIKQIVQGIDIGVFKTYNNLVTQIELDQTFDPTGSSDWNFYNTNRNGSIVANNGSFRNDAIPKKIQYNNGYSTVTLKKNNWSAASRAVNVGSGKKDSINLTPLFKTDTGKKMSTVKINSIDYTVNDLCPFRIEAIDTDKTSESIFMIFRAYLTDLSDDVSAEWNDVKYAGRGEKFYIYNGFTRKINVSFKVAALSAGEMEPMYQKLNNLMGNLMPDYKGTLMRGPFVRMTVGNWIDSQPGVLNSLSYKIPQDSPWEINIDENEKLILPHIVEVNLSFTPVGAQTKKVNENPNKATETQGVSYIAQNFNGDTSGANYITGSIASDKQVVFPTGDPTIPY